MSDYIKREDIRRMMHEQVFEKDSPLRWWDSRCWIRYKLFEKCVDSVPAADVVERKKGEWIWTETGDADYEQYWVCSECSEHNYYESNFCPNCGADMRNPTYTLSMENGTFSFRNTKGGDT